MGQHKHVFIPLAISHQIQNIGGQLRLQIGKGAGTCVLITASEIVIWPCVQLRV
jgi:hypothetical protein